MCLFLTVAPYAGCFEEAAHPRPDFPADSILEPETLEVSFYDEIPSLDDGYETTAEGLTVRQQGLNEELTVITSALVGEPSRAVPLVKKGLGITNTMVRPLLSRIRELTKTTPVLSTSTARNWVQQVEGGIYRFEVTVADDGRFEYLMTLTEDELDEASPANTVFSGFFVPTKRLVDNRQTGSGVIRYHYTELYRTIQGGGPSGRGAVGFRVKPQSRQLNIFFADFKANNSELILNGRYQYHLSEEGAGTLSFILNQDFLESVQGVEQISASAFWEVAGQGISKARVEHSQLEDAVFLDECWSSNRLQTWSEWRPEAPNGEISDGDPLLCVEPGFPLVIPETTFVGPDDLPSVPAEMP